MRLSYTRAVGAAVFDESNLVSSAGLVPVLALAERCGLPQLADRYLAGIDGPVLVDIDDTIVEVHGYAKQGAGFGYTGVRGLNALLATASTGQAAPVIVAQRLRKGGCGSARGAARLVADALATVGRVKANAHTGGTAGPVLVRADSAFYGYPTIAAALRAGAEVSVTVKLHTPEKAAIAAIDPQQWQPIEYTDAIFDEDTGRLISRAEVAEIPSIDEHQHRASTTRTQQHRWIEA